MNNGNRHSFSISGKSESGVVYSVEFSVLEEKTEVLKEFLELQEFVVTLDIIRQLREKCERHDSGLYSPIDKKLNQMKTLCLSAGASFPRVLSTTFIKEELKIPFNSYKVYASAKDHESSKYLELNEEKGVSISLEGIIWIETILKFK